MALSVDSRPHFTTIADFISGSSEEIAKLFQQVLLTCDEMGLIGKEMFAIDGCKLPSNASKEWSGTHENLKKKSKKIDRAVRYMLVKHRDEDRQGENDLLIRQRQEKQIKTLLKASDKIDQFLKNNNERLGHSGKELWLKCAQAKITTNIFMQFMGHKEDCAHCTLRPKCLRSTKQKGAWQVNVKLGSIAKKKHGPLGRMKQKIDSTIGRHIYSMRLGIVEPVFGHMNDAIVIKRFSLRGKKKVNGQWQLMTMLHNLTKIHRFGTV